MEAAIKSTLEEAKKIEEQISAILVALENNESISEAHLLELSSGNGKLSSSGKRQVPKKAVDKKMSKLGQGKKIIYELVEGSTFLVPVLEEWVFGMTLTNTSGIPQPCPELVLNILPQKKAQVDKPCKVFHYRVQVHPLDVKYGDRIEKFGEGIPFHNTFRPMSNKTRIQPGCQVITTAHFQFPINFLDKCKLDLVVSFMLSGTELWSRRVPLALDNVTALEQSENTFLLHQSSILMALSKHREHFKLNRLLSSPHKAVEKFLVPLGFEKISNNDSLGIDREVDVFASTKHHLSPLWGSIFKLEKCLRDANTVNCVISARSTQQYQMFMRLFQNWLKKEGREERRKGMSGLSVLPMILPAEDKNVMKTIQEEIIVINKLLDAKQKNRVKPKNRDASWIKEFNDVVCSTDDIFMNYLC